MLPDDQVHPDTHVTTMVNNVIGMVNYVIAARSSLLNFVIADNSDAPPPAAAAISSADQLSAALLAVALSGAGIDASLLSFSRLGMTAEGNALRARLTGVDEIPLRAALSTRQVVVLPGGQGASRDGSLMMLGRNSSDLSAVAAATAVDAAQCEIFSGLPGIYTADPRLVPSARPVPRVCYDTAAEIARSGAKILHEQAIRLAARHGLRIVCRGRPPAADSMTVVAESGQWQPMVIANTRGSVWAFTDRAGVRAARDRLAADGIDSIGHERHLIAESGAAERAVQRTCGVQGALTGLRLLSVLAVEGQPAARHLVPADELIRAARDEHQQLYPGHEIGNKAAEGERARRSPLSRVMFESSAPAATGSPTRVILVDHGGDPGDPACGPGATARL